MNMDKGILLSGSFGVEKADQLLMLKSHLRCAFTKLIVGKNEFHTV